MAISTTISKSIIKPYKTSSEKPLNRKLCHLTPWDLAMLTCNYIQKGLLFSTTTSTSSVVDKLKPSLAQALRHYYPLAGRLVTSNTYGHNGEATGMSIAIDCTDEGAEFIHAVAPGVKVADILASDTDVPSGFIREFFPVTGAINCDGHSLPLLAVQLTQLDDGHFIALCFNHVVGDGTSYWHFFNAWAEICRRSVNTGVTEDGFASVELSRPPVLERWFGSNLPPLKLPFKTHEEFIERFTPPLLRERVFHFSKKSMAMLKASANREYEEDSFHGEVLTISSYQALSSLMWRCLTRARELPAAQKTTCWMAAENRSRLRPPLHKDYFGNSIYAIYATATAEEILSKSLGWAAALLRRAVAEHDNKKIREMVDGWPAAPVVYPLSMFDACSVMMVSSPRFEMYECEFGWGRAAAVRGGTANKHCGCVTAYPGREGGGAVDLGVCLVPHVMEKLVEDEELTAAMAVVET